MVILSRLFHTLECGAGAAAAVSALTTFGYAEAPSSPIFAVFSFIVAQGLFSLTLIGLGQPLSFKLHFPLQLLTTFFMLSTWGLENCRQVSHITAPQCEWLSVNLDNLAKLVLEVMYSKVVKTEMTWKIEHPCLQISMFVQVYVGFGILSYLVWLLERRSRVAFIMMLPQEERPAEAIEPLAWFVMIMHGVLFLALFAVSWRAFSAVAPYIVEWGL